MEEKEAKYEENKEDNHENYRQTHRHGLLKLLLIVLAVLFGLSLIFAVGHLGNRRSFIQNSGFGNGYGGMMRNYNYNTQPYSGGMMGGRGLNSNSVQFQVSGSVSQINGSDITVKGASKDYSVIVLPNTSIVKANDVAKLLDLKVGDNVVISGPSNSDGTINATVISIR